MLNRLAKKRMQSRVRKEKSSHYWQTHNVLNIEIASKRKDFFDEIQVEVPTEHRMNTSYSALVDSCKRIKIK